ncbi:MAG: Uma2 family endonuclease [Candidatus Binatia bacterium]|nr:Uma2 family endonuclease [Candidatus Binatia bacterium]
MADLFQHEKVELLDGTIMTMSPQNSPHPAAVHRLLCMLLRILGSTAAVRIQAPPILNDTLLVIEVADTSLSYDRTQKASAYAASAIPEYWVVNLNERRVEIFTDPIPSAGHYNRQRLVYEGEELVLPNGLTIAASDILPQP